MARRRPDRDADRLVERVRDGLTTLGLPRVLCRLDQLLAQPEADLTRLEWLLELLQPQVHARVEARIERRIKQSRLPERKTLAEFDFDFQPKLDRDLVLELGTLAFLDHGKNVLLAGWSGTGKSHIAKALALNACMDNRCVRYTTSEKMLSTLKASLADDTLERALKQYTRPELLVIDEVGLEQVERAEARRAGLMQKVLLPRHNTLSTIITSNLEWSAWGDYLGDQLGAAAILDRLIHRSHVIVVEGPSWRDHEHNQDVAAQVSERRSRAAAKPAAKAASKHPAKQAASKPAKPRAKQPTKKSTSRTPAGTKNRSRRNRR